MELLSCDEFDKTWDLSMDTTLNDNAFCFNDGDQDLSTYLLSEEADRIETLSWNVGSFFGLPIRVQELIQRYKGIKRLYGWQIDCLCIDSVVHDRQNLLYSLPTSGGKTLVAEILMLKELVVNKRNVIFSLPYVALAQEKVRSLAPFGLELQFFVEEYVGGTGKYPPVKRRKKKSLYVCTIEKAAGLVDSLFQTKRIDEIGMFIVDEVHLVGDSHRGATLESTLTKLLFAAKHVQIISMSATIGNLAEIGQFLKAHVYQQDFRPVDLVQYVKCNDQIFKISKDEKGGCILTHERYLDLKKYLHFKIDPGFIGGLVVEIGQHSSCLVFCATRNACCNLAFLICRTKGSLEKDFKKAEKLALLRALEEEGQGMICSVLRKTIPYGVAYHHSGLTNAERKLLEEAFLATTINCICCTSTLAAGINLPAQRVIITSPFVGKDFIKLSTYKQMSGRAGRMGLAAVGESFLLCQECDKVKILNLLSSSMDQCVSKMDEKSFMKLSMDGIGLNITTSRSDISALFQNSLFQMQHACEQGIINNPLDDIVDNCLKRLKLLSAIFVSNDTMSEYSLTPIADAAMAGNFDIEDAHRVYDNLKEAAQKGVVLTNYLHLFYLITPYSAVDDVFIDRQIIISTFSELSREERAVAEHLGFTELCLIQYTKHGQVKCISNDAWHRFFRALIILEVWKKIPLWKVSEKFGIPRGTVHNFLTRTATFASAIVRFTEALNIEMFENFAGMIAKVVPRICYCCSPEHLQLMQLPSVKIGRAKQLLRAGYRTVRDISNADPIALVTSVDHLPRRLAYEIVAAAKLAMLEKVETLQEEADSIRYGLCDHMAEDEIFSEFDSIQFSQFSTPYSKKI